MSRFWAGKNDLSASESESESESQSSAANKRTQKERRQWALESDSDSDDEARVVRPVKERSMDSIRSTCINIKAAMKSDDWAGMQSNFDLVVTQIKKASAFIAADGIPKYFIKILVELEDKVAAIVKEKDAVKKLTVTHSRALNRLKLQLKRHNKDYEAQIEDCRLKPEEYGDLVESKVSTSGESSSETSDSESGSSSESSSESGSDSDVSKSSSNEESTSESESESESSSASTASKKKGKNSKAVDDLESDEWPSESSTSESDSSDDGAPVASQRGRAFWLKQTTTDDARTKKEKRLAAKQDEVKKMKKKEKADSEVRDRAAASARLGFKIDEKMTPATLDKKLREVLQTRGRKGTDSRDVLRQLAALAYICRRYGPAREIPILMHTVAAMFDLLRNIDDYMDVAMWRNCQAHLARITVCLDEYPDIRLVPMLSDELADLQMVAPKNAEEDESAENLLKIQTSGEIKVVGNLASYVQLLEEEYTKSLQRIDQYSLDYINRLKDENTIVSLASMIQRYFVRAGDMQLAAGVALLQIEHMYYKHDSIANAVLKSQVFAARYGSPSMLHPASRGVKVEDLKTKNFTQIHPASAAGSPVMESVVEDYASKILELCTFIYKYGSDRMKTRAMLCQISHHGLHDRFHAARDLLLMSHLQDIILMADVETQILYNRMMVTLGLCAFRSGLIAEAQDCLREICSSRTKELLAQGFQFKYQDKSPEQEKIERRRQTPYHMHINLELLECCHLTSAMLCEVANMAQERGDIRKRTISRVFRRHMDNYDLQVFTGPPENIRDHVIAGTKCLMQGEWKKCSKLILGLDVWNLIPGDGKVDKVKAMLKEKIQIEGLRTYLFTFSPCYDSISLTQLSELFEMPGDRVHSIISKMLVKQELHGAWDQPTKMLIFQSVDPSKLQILAIQFAEKAATLVESNERLLDVRTGTYSYRDEKWNIPTDRDRSSTNRGFKSERWNIRGSNALRGSASGGIFRSNTGRGGALRGRGKIVGQRPRVGFQDDRLQLRY